MGSKVTFVSVSQFGGLALCSPFGSVSGHFVTPCFIVSLEGRNKRKRKREEIKKNKPPGDFKPVQRVMLVFLDTTGRRGLGFTFLPSYNFEKMGTMSGLQYSQLSSLRPRSFMSCQAQISHSVSGCTAPVK